MPAEFIKALAESEIVGIDGRPWLMVPVREGFLDRLSAEYEKVKALEAQKK